MKCVCGKGFSINPPERDRAPRDGGGSSSLDEIDTGTVRIIDAKRDESLIITAICPFCERMTMAKVNYRDLLIMPKSDELHEMYGRPTAFIESTIR